MECKRTNSITIHFIIVYSFSISNFLYLYVPFASCSSTKTTELRERLASRIPESSVLLNYTKDDLFLLKWMKPNSMDVNVTTNKIIQHLKWRELNNIDEISMKRFETCSSWIEEEYPSYLGHRDKFGRPVAELWVSEWDLRKAIVSGQRKNLTLRLMYMAELLQRQILEYRSKGENVTHAIMLMDMRGFNLFTQGCTSCIAFISDWTRSWNTNYPDLFQNTVMINVNPMVHVLISLLRGAVKEVDVKKMKIFTGESTWKPVLDAMIEKNQRSTRFGGNVRYQC